MHPSKLINKRSTIDELVEFAVWASKILSKIISSTDNILSYRDILKVSFWVN